MTLEERANIAESEDEGRAPRNKEYTSLQVDKMREQISPLAPTQNLWRKCGSANILLLAQWYLWKMSDL